MRSATHATPGGGGHLGLKLQAEPMVLQSLPEPQIHGGSAQRGHPCRCRELDAERWAQRCDIGEQLAHERSCQLWMSGIEYDSQRRRPLLCPCSSIPPVRHDGSVRGDGDPAINAPLKSGQERHDSPLRKRRAIPCLRHRLVRDDRIGGDPAGQIVMHSPFETAQFSLRIPVGNRWSSATDIFRRDVVFDLTAVVFETQGAIQ